MLVGDQVLLLLGVGLGRSEAQTLLRQLMFCQRVDAFRNITVWLVFPLREVEAVFQYRADVIEGLSANPCNRLDAPFIKWLACLYRGSSPSGFC